MGTRCGARCGMSSSLQMAECSTMQSAEKGPVEFTSLSKEVCGEHVFINCSLQNLCL